MRFISLFGGIGGFDLALTRKGHQCVWYNDFDKYAVQTYNKNFGTEYEPTDIKRIQPTEIPEHDLLCAGFPCQAFSIAGKRLGFKDTRGTLFFDIARIVKIKKPRLIFLENVKGLLSHDNGRTITCILATLNELGYNAEWQVLNSKHFGVPQNRERVFIIGHFRESSGQQIFPLKASTTGTIKVRKRGKHQQDIVYDTKGILNLPAGTHGSTPHLTKIQSHSPRCGNPKKGGTGLLESSEHCFTIDSTPHYVNRIRRLTPIECERLQGFPDNWTEGVSDTQRYKQCGNAVTVNVIEAIAERLNV